ncbi:hypothetical protein [Tunturiibacter psychrotolerans]|uniref:hypothetical protein n=1 Tax=Tunturiibacter psychrotolerans TaxID=3069686 RepID=UPI003D1C915F
MAWLTEQQLLTMTPAQIKTYAGTLQTALKIQETVIDNLTELVSTEFATPNSVPPNIAKGQIKLGQDIASVRDTFTAPVLALSYVVGAIAVPPFPAKIGNPFDATFLRNTLIGLQSLLSEEIF